MDPFHPKKSLLKMKTAFQADNVDYSFFSSTTIDPLSWHLNQESANMSVASPSVSTSVSPPSTSVASPSALENNSIGMQEVSLQIPATLPMGSVSSSITSLPINSYDVTGTATHASHLENKSFLPPSKAGFRAPIVKPSPAEEELVRRIHRKVGGPAKLSTYDDPAKVRYVVIEALANEQPSENEASRVRKGQLSVFERRVVRTVTNRGAAVRSRMRQRKEMAHLKQQLRLRDVRVHQLESVVRALCSAYAVPLPPSVGISDRHSNSLDISVNNEGNTNGMVPVEPVLNCLEGISHNEDVNAISRDTMGMGIPTNSNEIAFQQLQQPMCGMFESGVTNMPWS